MDMTQLVERQKRYFSTGATRNVENRKKALNTLLQGLERREEELLAALKADLGKGAFEGYMSEVGMVRAEARHALKHVAKWSRSKRVKGPLSQFPSRGEILREPYGTALIIAPWNYPVQLNLVPLISALAAGCTAVVKPSAYAPATSHALAQLLGECFSPEYVAVVEGGRAENTALLEQPFDRIFFTGSPAVGRTVMAAAARHLTPVTLELGGKSPVILTVAPMWLWRPTAWPGASSSTLGRPVWPPTMCGSPAACGTPLWRPFRGKLPSSTARTPSTAGIWAASSTRSTFSAC